MIEHTDSAVTLPKYKKQQRITRYIIIHPGGISTGVPKPGNYTKTDFIEKLRKLSRYNSNQVPSSRPFVGIGGLKRLMLNRTQLSCTKRKKEWESIGAEYLKTNHGRFSKKKTLKPEKKNPPNCTSFCSGDCVDHIGFRTSTKQEWEAELCFFSEQHHQGRRTSISTAAFSQNRLISRTGSEATRFGLALSPPICLDWLKTLVSLSPLVKLKNLLQKSKKWFGQLQAVDLQSIQPAIRADTEGGNFRDDLPETFENREAMISAVPNYEEPFIKVPKVLNKE
ncbi:uncharacterized protein LOC131326792 [Rhododendron vialii]|uniref:uncharacterized protein LOC131326792 n=1 Tax=Rhododendron vialii TaxID=182163 RepID=UPI00265FAFF5|nr:uncharacterized protein LOC131326792 [Rhododendron vialii]